MSNARWRPPEAYVHGIGAPVVVVPGRVAAWLERHTDLRRLRAGVRGQDPEIDAVLVALATAAAAWRATATGTPDAARPEAESPCQQMSTGQAADLLGVTPRAVRQAVHEGRLTAERVGSRWLLDREDVEHYRAKRAA
jgi:excisionase family DNA binding protein